MVASEGRYERVPASLEEGERRGKAMGDGAMVSRFGRYAYHGTATFIALCVLFALLPLSSSWTGTLLSKRALAPSDQTDQTMDAARCRREFPALYPQLQVNVEAWRQKGGIRKDDVDTAQRSAAERWGHARVIIKDGQLYIRQVKEGNESRMSALLHILHAAVSSDPSGAALPPLDMVLTSADLDGNTSPVAWVIDKRVDEDPKLGRWLLPDFGFAGWPEAGIASYREFTRLIEKEERDYPWERKDEHAFWRGLANWYPVRKDLLNRTSTALDPSRKEWADVSETSFHDVGEEFTPIVPMHEHCRRKYLIQSEGNSYSGRFKYLLTCEAVTIAHPLEWTQHFHPALDSEPGSRHQNMVELPGPLFSGLEEAVRNLQQLDRGVGGQGNHPRKIAANAQRILKERYLTPAATMCYVRAALQSYASVQQTQTWGQDPIDLVAGPHPAQGSGVVPSGGRGKDLAKLGAKGDIEYGVWRLSGSVDWPPRSPSA